MATTPHLGITTLASNQQNAHTTLNLATRILDAFARLSVKDRDLATPPGSPADGDRYYVAASPTGAWTGQAGKIAIYISGWYFFALEEGWNLWVDDEKVDLRYTDGALIRSDVEGSIFQSRLTSGLLNAITDTRAYFTYLGQREAPTTPGHVDFLVTTAGIGTQTAEVGLFSSPAAPNVGDQSLTKLVATGTVDDLTTTGRKRNTSAFATLIPARTHLWAGLRVSMTVTQPTCLALQYDLGEGQVLITSGASALTGAGPWSGVRLSSDDVFAGPDLRATLA